MKEAAKNPDETAAPRKSVMGQREANAPPCEIEASLTQRKAAGAINSTVKKEEAKSESEPVFALKQTGPKLDLKNKAGDVENGEVAQVVAAEEQE